MVPAFTRADAGRSREEQRRGMAWRRGVIRGRRHAQRMRSASAAVARRCSLFLPLNFALGRGSADNVFKVKVSRENEVILLIDVTIYIPSE
jgi:hypothetical protein